MAFPDYDPSLLPQGRPQVQPSFLQRVGTGFNQFAGNQDLALALLANSGYGPKRSFGQILGQSGLQAQQMGQQRQQQDMENQFNQARLAALQNPVRKPLAVLGPDGQPTYVDEQDAIGKTPYAAMQRAEAPASLQELAAENVSRKGKGLPEMSIGDWYKLRASAAPLNPTVQLINGVPTLVQPTNRSGSVATNPLSNQQSEFDAASGKAGATAGGEATAKRIQAQIDVGVDAADSLATLNRSLDLLNSVGTGGLDAAKLKATQMFGVTGADESELSANLGKTVLSQLRATFGAAFTEREGARLADIEAGFGKSTEGNKRLLEQAKKILDRAARRGLDAAERSGDTFTANEIRKSMEFTLTPNSAGAPKVGTVENGYSFKGGDPSKPENWVKQ